MSDHTLIRLYVPAPMHDRESLLLDKPQSHYLINVMRMSAGDPLLVFNGTDGEWKATIQEAHKKSTTLALHEQTRPHINGPDVWLLFAPLKKDRTDFVIEKATELGVSQIMPVATHRTQTSRINVERLQATAIEAAEQSRRLTKPEVLDVQSLNDILNNWPANRRLIYMDETGNGAPLISALGNVTEPLGILIGPEGGFETSELDALGKLTFSVGADLGPRILRAETAVVAALAIRQAVADKTK